MRLAGSDWCWFSRLVAVIKRLKTYAFYGYRTKALTNKKIKELHGETE